MAGLAIVRVLVFCCGIAATIASAAGSVAAQGTDGFIGTAAGARLPFPSFVRHQDAEYRFAPDSLAVPPIRMFGVNGVLYESVTRYENVSGHRVAVRPTDVIRYDLHDATLVASASGASPPRVVLRLQCNGMDACQAAPAAFSAGAIEVTRTSASAFQMFPDMRAIAPSEAESRDPHRNAYAMAPRILSDVPLIHSAAGALEAWFWESTVEIRGGDGTKVNLRAGRTHADGPAGLAPGEEERYLHVRARARIEEFRPPSGILASRVDAAFQLPAGELELMEASGVLAIGTRRFDVEGAHLRIVSGSMQSEVWAPGAWAERRHGVEARGAVEAAWIDGVRVTEELGTPVRDPSWPPILVAAGFVAGLVLLLRSSLVAMLWSSRTRASDWRGYVERTLANGRRARIYALIRENPGIQPFQLWHRVGGAFGVTLRSLERLERVRLVASRRTGRFRHYFDSSAAADPSLAMIMARPALRETYEAIQRFGPASEPALRAVLSVSHASFAERAARLLDAGLAIRRRKGRRYVYSLPGEAARASETRAEKNPGEAASTAAVRT